VAIHAKTALCAQVHEIDSFATNQKIPARTLEARTLEKHV
jgi:hypothetical protein